MLLTAAEAAEILGITVHAVYNLVQRGRLTRHGSPHGRRVFDRDEVEARALARLTRVQNPPPHPYWATVEEAAEELGVAKQTVNNWLAQDRMPSMVAASGRRYLRRHQLQVIANAWEAQFWADLGEPDDAGPACLDPPLTVATMIRRPKSKRNPRLPTAPSATVSTLRP